MWASLKQNDIDRAKQQLNLRRAEILKRQAEEINQLEADQAQIDAVNRLVDLFAQKYKMPAPVLEQLPNPVPEQAPAPAAMPERARAPAEPPKQPARAAAEPAAAKASATTPVPRAAPTARRSDHRNPPRTNFEAFSRAVSRSTF